jgi:polysaccharide biosynthesis protein PslG
VSRQLHHKPLFRRPSFGWSSPRALLPLLALLLLALALFTIVDNAYNRGITYTPTSALIAWADVPQLGVNAYNIQYEAEPAKVTRTLEMARDLGAQYVRMQMPWDDLEITAKGDFFDHKNNKDAWAKYDFIVAEANRLGLELIARLDRPPAWARAAANATPQFQEGLARDGNSTGPPDKIADYADFVGAVASRYRGKLRFLQIWNEPNLKNEWNWRTPVPAEFVELLRAGYTAAKQANPDVVILFPSLSPTDGRDKKAPMTELEYLDQVYALGGKPYFDIMSAQAYGLGQPPDEHRYIRPRLLPDRPIDTRIDVSRVVLLREVMERNGDAAKAIWISEFGYNSAPEQKPDADPQSWPVRRVNWGQPVSEQLKGDYLVGQLERARAEWPWIGVMNVWLLRWGGPDPDPNDPTPYFALVQPDFTPLPAYEKLKAFMEAGPLAGVGRHAWSHPAVAARGPNQWVVRFEGTSFALVDLHGPIEIAIDQEPPRAMNPLMERRVLPIAEGLANGEHSAVIRSANGPPSAFLVGRAAPLAWLWALVPALLLVALVAVGALIGKVSTEY